MQGLVGHCKDLVQREVIGRFQTDAWSGLGFNARRSEYGGWEAS